MEEDLYCKGFINQIIRRSGHIDIIITNGFYVDCILVDRFNLEMTALMHITLDGKCFKSAQGLS